MKQGGGRFPSRQLQIRAESNLRNAGSSFDIVTKNFSFLLRETLPEIVSAGDKLSPVLGDLPGIGMTIIDGIVSTLRSRNTPPATTAAGASSGGGGVGSRRPHSVVIPDRAARNAPSRDPVSSVGTRQAAPAGSSAKRGKPARVVGKIMTMIVTLTRL